MGSALAVKPLLQIEDGRIVPLEKVRTSAKALAAARGARGRGGRRPTVDIAVSHLVNLERADALAERLKARVGGLQDLVVTQVGAVIGAHVGPGMLAVVVSPRL